MEHDLPKESQLLSTMSFREVKPGLKVVTRMLGFSLFSFWFLLSRRSGRLAFQAFSKAWEMTFTGYLRLKRCLALVMLWSMKDSSSEHIRLRRRNCPSCSVLGGLRRNGGSCLSPLALCKGLWT